MTIRQLHYTSCQHGRDGTQGFQVSASSAGLAEQHEDLGLRLSAYRRSPSAPMQPTEEQIGRFPVAVGYQPCGEVAVLFHSRYLGTDFTGRQGNYFAHILVLDAPAHELSRILPIEAWGSPLWQWQPAQQTQLPLVDEITPGPLADRERLRTELLGGRLPAFGALLSAVQDGLTGRVTRVVVVAPDAADVARALAVVTRSLPAALARAVSFTTFTATPADTDVLVAGTTPDVEISPSPFGDRIVITLSAEGPGERTVSRYASVLGECWNRGTGAVGAAGELAGRISPALQPAELDQFADLVELAVLGPDGPAQDPLAGVEFALQRLPAVLTPALWQQLDEHSRRGSFGDVERWSEVFAKATRAGCGPGPELEASYLRAALSRIAEGALDPGRIWLPEQMGGPRQDVVIDWAASAMKASLQLDTARQLGTATSVLSTMSRLRIRLPGPSELQDAVVEVVLAVLCDPQRPESPDLLRQLPDAERLLPLACRTLDKRLADNDELIDMVVEGLPPAAAELVAAHAPPGSRCAMTASLARARTSRAGRVDVLLRAVGKPARPAEVERFANLLWPDLPTATEAVRLCHSFDGAVLAATALPQRLLDRLIEDAEGSGLSAADEELASQLATRPVADQLANGLNTAECVRWGTHFNGHPHPSRKRDQEAVEAVRSSTYAATAVADWTREAVANWMLWLAEPTQHGPVLLRVLQEAGSPDFLSVYSRQLADKLAAAKPPAIAALLPAVVFAAHHHPASRQLLENACRGALRGRRRRDLDNVGRCFDSDAPKFDRLLPDTGRRAKKSWSAWWNGWRDHNIPQSALSRLLGRRRADGD